MLTRLDPTALKSALIGVFEKFYQPDVADSLAIMHAEMHINFARSLGQVPVVEKDQRHTMQAQRTVSRARLAQAVRRARASDTRAPRSRDLPPEILRQELLDYAASVGRPNISITEAVEELKSFGASRYMVNRAMIQLIKDGSMKQVCGTRKKARYELVKPEVSEEE